MASHLTELQAIVDDKSETRFETVMAVFDRAGGELDKISMVFSNLTSSLNTPELQTVQTEMAPLLAGHTTKIYTLPGLWTKIDKAHNQRLEEGLNSEQIRLAERLHMDFCRHGAKFDAKKSEEYAGITARLAELETKFMQNVMADEGEWQMQLSLKAGDLQGCADGLIAAARAAAEERAGTSDKKRPEPDAHVITLSRSLVEPFLTFADSRPLREKAWRAWTRRGELDPKRANKPIAEEILRLRLRQGALHGKKSFAEYQCEDMMAKKPEAVMELLEKVWAPAKESADGERAALEEFVAAHGEALEGGIQAWDWRYYAEKVRRSKYDFDEEALKPYLSLEAMTQALLSVSGSLYGLSYNLRPDIVSYHPDVDTYEVKEADPATPGEDRLVAIFIHDNFARHNYAPPSQIALYSHYNYAPPFLSPSLPRQYKSSGAWMSEYRGQRKNLGPTEGDILKIPIISNNNNFNKPGKDEPSLLSFDDAVTLFHEMGHGKALYL